MGGGTDIKYSTAEHIIGKVNENGTIKDLYEKTLNGSITNANLDIQLGISSISKLYSVNGGIDGITGSARIALPWGFTNISASQYVAVFVIITTLMAGIRVSSHYVGYDYTISLTYTKN